jgi:drug/metabolite transporter (DMT)-like permease
MSRLSPPAQAALLMIVGAASAATMNCVIRVLSAEQHPFEIAFFRNLFGLVVMLLFLVRAGRGALRTRSTGWLVLSSFGHLVAMLSFFVAVAAMPLAELTALSFTKPLFATVGAALVLHEVVRARRWSAVAIGFLGVLIVMRPGTAAVSPYALLVLLSTLAIAAVALLIKHLSDRESATTIVFYQSLLLSLFSLPPALLVWQVPSAGAFALLIAIGALGTVSWMCFTRAFALADASAVMPYEFLKLPIIALLAYLLFAEVPTLWTWLGGAVIFSSTVYIAQREARVARTRAAAAAAGAEAIAPPASPRA